MCRFLTRSSLGLSAKQPILHLPHPLLASTYLCKNNTIIGRQNKVTTVANITTWALKINALITGCLEMSSKSLALKINALSHPLKLIAMNVKETFGTL